LALEWAGYVWECGDLRNLAFKVVLKVSEDETRVVPGPQVRAGGTCLTEGRPRGMAHRAEPAGVKRGSAGRSRMIAAESHIAVPTLGFAGGGRRSQAGGWVWASVLLCGLLLGCSQSRDQQEAEQVGPTPPGTRIAVAPALNFSGSCDFDPVKVADLMASELSSLPGLGVIGVNRVLAILAEQGVDRIQSPEHALAVCDRLGAHGMLVFAITEYDSYKPVVGMAAQLYGPHPPGPALDPVAASRMARPFPVPATAEATRPWAQLQRVFNGSHQAVQREVRRYAEPRGEDDSPYGWRRYLVSQTEFLRYCCFTVADGLMRQQQESDAAAGLAAAKEPGL